MEKETQSIVCGHCKYTCADIEELKQHMKDNHIPKGGNFLRCTFLMTRQCSTCAIYLLIFYPVDVIASSTKDIIDAEPKQNVLVYRQNPDGSTSSTGQMVQLTQSQILQLTSGQQTMTTNVQYV